MLLDYRYYRKDIENLRKFVESSIHNYKTPKQIVPYGSSENGSHTEVVDINFDYLDNPIKGSIELGYVLDTSKVKISTLLSKDKSKCYLFIDTRNVPAFIDIYPGPKNVYSNKKRLIFTNNNHLNALYTEILNTYNNTKNTTDPNDFDPFMITLGDFSVNFSDLSKACYEDIETKVKSNSDYKSLSEKDMKCMEELFMHTTAYNNLKTELDSKLHNKECTLSSKVDDTSIAPFVLPLVMINFDIKDPKNNKEMTTQYPEISMLSMNTSLDIEFDETEFKLGMDTSKAYNQIKNKIYKIISWSDFIFKLDYSTMIRK